MRHMDVNELASSQPGSWTTVVFLSSIPTMKRFLHLVCAIVVLSASSCIGIEANTRIAANGVMDLDIKYTVSLAADELGRLGANASYLPLPVARSDMELAAARAGGTVRSWSRNDGKDRFTIQASVNFPNPEAFVAFMDPLGRDSSYSFENGIHTLRISLGGGSPPSDQDLAAFIREAFADYRITLAFDLPGAPIANDGMTVNGRRVQFDRLASDLYTSKDRVSIRLSW